MNLAESLLAEKKPEFATNQASVAERYGAPQQDQSLRECVGKAVNNYFQHLDGQDVTSVYDGGSRSPYARSRYEVHPPQSN